MSTHAAGTDSRTPSPPYGYSRECTHTRDEQIAIVAEFHAHRIRPSRIAYRVGIDIAFVEELIAGETEVERFSRLVAQHRTRRYRQRLNDSRALSGSARYELQQKIERDYVGEVDL